MSTADLGKVADAVALLQWAKARKAEVAEVEKTARAAVEEALGEHEAGTLDGDLVITWRRSKRNALDQAALKRDHPEIVASYTATTEVRRFEVI